MGYKGYNKIYKSWRQIIQRIYQIKNTPRKLMQIQCL